jgi:hypothetical protein
MARCAQDGAILHVLARLAPCSHPACHALQGFANAADLRAELEAVSQL